MLHIGKEWDGGQGGGIITTEVGEIIPSLQLCLSIKKCGLTSPTPECSVNGSADGGWNWTDSSTTDLHLCMETACECCCISYNF